MEKIFINATEDTPRVTLDPENNLYELFGRSLPEDAAEFYEPILKWLDEFAATIDSNSSKTELVIKLEYFNTTSSKFLLDIFGKLEDMHADGKNVVIHWYYFEEDIDMKDAGEEFSDLIEVPFEMFTYDYSEHRD